MKIRNCAWATGDEQSDGKTKPVWGRSGIFSRFCPKSIITPKSLHFLEQFRWAKRLGTGDIWNLPARTAEAFAVLEGAWEKENQRVEDE